MAFFSFLFFKLRFLIFKVLEIMCKRNNSKAQLLKNGRSLQMIIERSGASLYPHHLGAYTCVSLVSWLVGYPFVLLQGTSSWLITSLH